jgi:hypothetical protein
VARRESQKQGDSMMEYVQRAKYGPKHKKRYEMHDRVHLSDGFKTLCGHELTVMWFVTGNDVRKNKTVTCKKCLDSLNTRRHHENHPASP